jgi:hypothetical protein
MEQLELSPPLLTILGIHTLVRPSSSTTAKPVQRSHGFAARYSAARLGLVGTWRGSVCGSAPPPTLKCACCVLRRNPQPTH